MRSDESNGRNETLQFRHILKMVKLETIFYAEILHDCIVLCSGPPYLKLENSHSRPVQHTGGAHLNFTTKMGVITP